MTRMITIVKKEDDFKYTSFTTTQKSGIEARMANYGIYSMGGSKNSSYSGRVSFDRKYIFLYTAQKYRRKCIHTTKKPGKNASVRLPVKTSNPIRPSYWEVRVFRFPLDRVINAKQNLRTFKISITG